VKILPPVANQLDCLVQLQLGQADAVVTDGALAASQAAQDPTVELKGTTFTKEYYGVAMNKSADDLVRRVNRILETYRTSPTGWRASYTKWLQPTLQADSKSANPPVPQYK
jgi:polar amino acid transport system substrate-binding protein